MFPRDQDPPEHGPRARLARRVWTLALGLLVEASALAIAVALLVVPAKLEAALGAPWKVESGLIVLALGTLTVIHLLHAWRTGAAACASGLPGLSCRAFACFAGAVWLAGAAVLALLPTLPTWLASSTPSSQSDTQMVKLILVLVIATPIAIGASAVSLWKFLRSDGLVRLLPESAEDRLAWFLYPRLGDAAKIDRARSVAADERLLFSFDGLMLTTKRLLVRGAAGWTFFPRANVVDLTFFYGEKAAKLVFDLQLTVVVEGGARHAFATKVASKQPDGLALVRFILSGELAPQLENELSLARAAASAHVAPGEKLLAAIPGRLPKRKKKAPYVTPEIRSGTAVATGRVLAFDERGVRAAIEVEKHDALVVSETAGFGLNRRYAIEVWHGDRVSRRLSFKARTLDAYVLLRALLEHVEPSDLVIYPSSQSRGEAAHVHIPIH